MSGTGLDQRVKDVRRFNRFYTNRIGVLQEGILSSSFSLTEARVLYELANQGETTATHLGQTLNLDAGYLSRILRSFSKRRLLRKTRSTSDGRQSLLSMTDGGRKAFSKLDAASRTEIERALGALASEDQKQLVSAMGVIERLLGAESDQQAPFLLRPHQPGDMGWVVQHHGALYSAEYGWDEAFEGLVAEIVSNFIKSFDPRRERCWIAEKDGQNVGCVFLVQHPEKKDVARLRLLLVNPRARGLGIGNRLVAECSRFARQCGYRKITLWTNSVLHAARHIYEKEGYELIEETSHHSFGHDLVGQTWELAL